ncbi:MAG: hypothetical protein ACN6OX_12990 [Pseudomonas sp.]
MDTNKMRDISREQFEAVFSEKYPMIFAAAKAGESEAHGAVSIAWWGWQASREAVVVELPKVVGFEGAYDSHRHHEFVPSMSDVEDADEIFGLCRRVEAKEAIEAQGLKVAP